MRTLAHSPLIPRSMGAGDSIAEGRSTFMVELDETSYILRRATPRSLVLLDELGRGTSTHDGTAIAYATLEHVLRRLQACTLFVTHYPLLGHLHDLYPQLCRTAHMACLECPESHTITFLYKLIDGIAPSSYGVNVARLAGIDPSILDRASVLAADLERQVSERTSAAGISCPSTSCIQLSRLVRAIASEVVLLSHDKEVVEWSDECAKLRSVLQ